MKIKTPLRIPVKTIFCFANFLLICDAIHRTYMHMHEKIRILVPRLEKGFDKTAVIPTFPSKHLSELTCLIRTQSCVSVEVSRSFHVFRSFGVISCRPGKKNSSLTSLYFSLLAKLRYKRDFPGFGN